MFQSGKQVFSQILFSDQNLVKNSVVDFVMLKMCIWALLVYINPLLVLVLVIFLICVTGYKFVYNDPVEKLFSNGSLRLRGSDCSVLIFKQIAGDFKAFVNN